MYNQLSLPQSMSFDSFGNIWVADSNNNRIQKFVLNNDTCGMYPMTTQSKVVPSRVI